MKRQPILSIILIIIWAITLVLLCMEGLRHAGAQDVPIGTCYTPSDAGAVFTFSNIPDNWFGDTGWYYVGDAVEVEEHTLKVTGLQFDNGYAYAIVGTGDYSENITATTENTPACVVAPSAPQTTENGRMEPFPVQPISPLVVSTGTTCVVKYPQLILVCTPHGN